ncbi:MAG: hypothetical protein HY702_06725, partial [Gemmatimonadetes bacterium]|nr:hypothetical protein [Gemmatimonadota bacterium]
SAREAWQALDMVLRMGVFGLVISEGAPPPSVALRLERFARRSNAAWVVLVRRTGVVPGAALRVQFEWKAPAVEAAGRYRIAVRAVRNGITRSAEFSCDVAFPYRLCDDPGLPDRRARAGCRV